MRWFTIVTRVATPSQSVDPFLLLQLPQYIVLLMRILVKDALFFGEMYIMTLSLKHIVLYYNSKLRRHHRAAVCQRSWAIDARPHVGLISHRFSFNFCIRRLQSFYI